MFDKTYLVVCAFTAIAMAQIPAPTCYQGGPTAAGPSSDCTQFVDTFCNSAALITTRVNDSIGHCYNLPNSNVCDFIAWNTFSTNTPPSAVNCKAVLHNVISKCSLGGFGQAGPGAYTFTVDVNHGQCSHDVHGGS